MEFSFLKKLSNSDLHQATCAAATKEHQAAFALLHHIREAEGRRLYAEYGYSSLFDYLMNELKYSASSAMRRINAMRLIRDVPEAEESIRSGALNVTAASRIQSFFEAKRIKGEAMAPQDKKELVELVQNRSKRETEKILAGLEPMPVRPEQERVVTPTQTEIRFTADEDLMKEFERIKELISHVHPNASYLELFKYMTRLTLGKIDPLKKEAKTPRKTKDEVQGLSEKSTNVGLKTVAPTSAKASVKSNQLLPPVAIKRAWIPRHIWLQVWKRDQGCCAYQGINGKVCGSRFRAQVDHIIPIAQGGTNELSNLRVLCKSHNLLAAIKALGEQKMSQYLVRV